MLIGAYYYAWYRQNWLMRTVRQLDRPVYGEYDNTTYNTVIPTHMELMMKFGIDFISVSWNGDDLGYVLDNANKVGMKVTYFYESLRRAGQDGIIREGTHPFIIKDMDLVKEAMDEDCWLRIDGRPVMMFYVTRCYRENPERLFSEIRKAVPDVFLVGDEYFWDAVPDEKIQLFDAVTAYNMYQPGRFAAFPDTEVVRTYMASSIQQMNIHKEQCERLDKPLWGCAMPGYDDIGVRPKKRQPAVPRMGTRFFKEQLALANNVSVKKQAMMICSWNEFYEDTQIEPCMSYKNRYLGVLKNFVNNL